MKSVVLSIATISAILTTSATAAITAEVGAGIWQPSLSGHVRYNGLVSGTSLDFSEAQIQDETETSNNYIYADFSHFIPVVPNARVEKLKYTVNGTGNLTTTIFGNEAFSGITNTSIDITQTDYIAYWNVPFISIATAGTVTINFGLDVKNLNGSVTLSNSTQNETASFDEYLPLGYLNARIDVPFLPVELAATTKRLSYDGAKVSDDEVKASINLPIPLPLIDVRFDIGYKKQNVTIPDSLVSDFDAYIDVEGLFFGVSAKF